MYSAASLGPFFSNLVVLLLTKHRPGTSAMTTAAVLHSLVGHLLSQTLSSPRSFTPISSITLWTVRHSTELYCTSDIQFWQGRSHAFAKPEILFQALLYLLLSLALNSSLLFSLHVFASLLSLFPLLYSNLFILSFYRSLSLVLGFLLAPQEAV